MIIEKVRQKGRKVAKQKIKTKGNTKVRKQEEIYFSGMAKLTKELMEIFRKRK